MSYIQNLHKNSQKFIEPTAFVTLSLLAGSHRLIKYFPGASRGGLFISAGISCAAVCLYDYKLHKDSHSPLRTILSKIALIDCANIISGYLAKPLKERALFTFSSTFL